MYPEHKVTSVHAQELAVDLDELHQALHTQIADVQQCYQGPVDTCQAPAPEFKVGVQVYIKAKYFCMTRPSWKLSKKFLRPFEIIRKAGSHSFILRLPKAMRAVHPVFHISMLEPVTPNTIPNHIVAPPPPVEIDGDFEHKISKVLDSKIDKCRICKLLYLVRWTGYEGTDEETSWLPAMELVNASKAVSDFHHTYPNKPGPLNLLSS